MRYELRMTAFDMMEDIHIVVGLYESSGVSGVSHTLVERRVLTVRGTGESDPIQWTTDVLVAAIETL
jgi:hypothetical protein